ncbi:MAG: DUF4253 domain-containing protein [Pseudomonadales bacterium]|nr:DUF4253 domain-containing protein [Pseudomonadales bacterium]
MKFITLEPNTAFKEAIESLKEPKRIVVCGSEEDKQYIEEAMQASTQHVDEILAGAENIDIQAWFQTRKKELAEDLEMDLNESVGEWLGEPEAKQGFTLTFDMLSGQPHKNIVGAGIETDESWKIPAFFKYGGWNDCPDPELHCAIWKYWQQKYGAHIVGVSNDVIEAYITNPPTTQNEAMQLAWEQYLYCYDIVDQGVETISNLGASIINHNSWYFWWD